MSDIWIVMGHGANGSCYIYGMYPTEDKAASRVEACKAGGLSSDCWYDKVTVESAGSDLTYRTKC